VRQAKSRTDLANFENNFPTLPYFYFRALLSIYTRVSLLVYTDNDAATLFVQRGIAIHTLLLVQLGLIIHTRGVSLSLFIKKSCYPYKLKIYG